MPFLQDLVLQDPNPPNTLHRRMVNILAALAADPGRRHVHEVLFTYVSGAAVALLLL